MCSYWWCVHLVIWDISFLDDNLCPFAMGCLDQDPVDLITVNLLCYLLASVLIPGMWGFVSLSLGFFGFVCEKGREGPIVASLLRL